jgi:hypothetical protein
MGVLAWMTIAVVAIVAMVMLLAYPGLWIVAVVALGAVLVAAILMLISRGQADIDAMDDDDRPRAR